MSLRVGVDVGGTFTDFCLIDRETGELRVFKRPSTPHDQSEGIAIGLDDLLARAGKSIEGIEFLAHGTTVATNTLLEGKADPVGLLTTRGFRDLLELGRGVRPDIYNSSVGKPPLLVRGPWRLEVKERVGAHGQVIEPLDESGARAAIRSLKREGAGTLAVCLLHSYARPAHERRLKELIDEEHPEAYVSLSSEVMPEFREFERFSSTVLNSALGRVIQRYLRGFAGRLTTLGLRIPPQIMRSNGGIMSLGEAERLPVSVLLSGPAAGVVGAIHVARQAGYDNIITFDMGGTSTDVSLVHRGELVFGRLRRLAGYELKQPMVDVQSIGAGGGSIARVDRGGFVHVGPESAGAVPGPACYGLGGELPTVTDANLLIGRLAPQGLLGGTMALQPEQAERAISKHVAEPLGIDPVAAGLGVIAVVNAAMLGAIRRISVERGHDPREYALVAFGGAGPLHAAELARAMGIPTVLVPEYPGVLSALGLLVSDVRTEFSATRVRPSAETSAPDAEAIFRQLEAQAVRWLEREGVPEAQRRITRAVDMRYVGQNHELTVRLPGGLEDEKFRKVVEARFAARHRETYGHAETAPTEIVTFRVIATGLTRRQRIRASWPDTPGRAPGGTRRVALAAGRQVTCRVVNRAELRVGQRIAGPAIIEQMDTTTLVLEGQVARLDRFRNLVISEAR